MKFALNGLMLAAASLVSHMDVMAEDTTYVSAGINFRSFKDLSIQPIDFNGGNFMDGSITGQDGINPLDTWTYKVVDPLQQINLANIEIVTYTKGRSSGGSERMDDGLGLILRYGDVVAANENWQWGWELSLATATTDGHYEFAATASSESYDMGGPWSEEFVGGGPDPNVLELIFTPATLNQLGVSDGNGRAAFRTDLDLSIYTFGLAPFIKLEQPRWSCQFSGGPAITLADFEMSHELIGYWSDGSGTFYRESIEDEAHKFRLGLFAEAQALVKLNENWGVGASLRYDFIPVEIRTDLTEMDISGGSYQFFVNYIF